MKALVKKDNKIELQEVPEPILTKENNVKIKVKTSAICRTDIYIAEDIIKTKSPLILGHEFSGVIIETTSTDFRPRDRVAVNPLISCGNCICCKKNKPLLCQNVSFLGMDRDGSFADFIVVPDKNIYLLPDDMDFVVGAYLEPIAATLAVFNANIKGKGLIYGNNRFSQLVKKIFDLKGFKNVVISENAGENEFDFAVETFLTDNVFSDIIRAVRPNGKVILKSRQYKEVSFVPVDLVNKEITLESVKYGCFNEALKLLNDYNEYLLKDMVGEIHPLENFDNAFSVAKETESKKQFFIMGENE